MKYSTIASDLIQFTWLSVAARWTVI